MKTQRFFVTILISLFAITGIQAGEYSLWTQVAGETASKQVPFTYKTNSKTLDVTHIYTLTVEQGVNTNYDHAILSINYSELSDALGTSVSSSNVGNMIYYPLTDGTYGHNNDNWFDSNGFRSSWSSSGSRFFIQHITSESDVFIFWVGQHGNHTSSVGDTYNSTFYMVGDGTTAIEFQLTLRIVEQYPVNVNLNDVEVTGSKVIDINDYISTNTSNPMTSVSGYACDNVPELIGMSISNFTENMMYAPLDDATLCRTKLKSSGKAFWYQNSSNEPGLVYNQTTWNAATARTFLNIQGFYQTDQTLQFGYGQYCGNTQEGTYVMKVYLLGSKNETGKYRAYEVTVNLNLTVRLVDEWVVIPETSSIANVRDLGGWTTENGETVQYGKLFRGSELNGDKYNINTTDKALLHDELGIRAELDLRKHSEAKAISVSPLGSDVDYLRVVNEPYYLDGAQTAFANYRNDFDFILQHLRQNEPVYFHCIWGADRTGTLAFLLEGLLGLSEENLYKEYEITQLSNPEGEVRTRDLLQPLMEYIKTFDGETLQQKFINYWHQHAHIELADLNEFCQIMLGTNTDYVGDLPEAMDNIAYYASTVEASYTAAWNALYAIYNGIVGFGELANAQTWGSWSENRPAEQWLRYEWTNEQIVERVRVFFWSNSTNAGNDVCVPDSWKIQYWDINESVWRDVTLLDGENYTSERAAVNSVKFSPVTTTQLRLVMQAQTNGTTYSALGVTEWEVFGHAANESITYGDYPIQNVDFSHVHLTDQFWAPRMLQNQTVTIPVALQQCENSNRMLNFQKAAAILRGENIGYFDTECTFDDTDIYKILEGMAYSIQTSYSQELDDKMDELIALVASAQEPDGYLYTARTAGKPGSYHSWVGENRWEKDPDLSHELYNAGHLYEAAAAHYISTGKTTLLDVATKNADLLVKDFLYGGLTYEPGHQIVEMGLVKLYRITGKEDYLKLAKYFLDLRGARGVMRKEYSQTHKPVTMQDEAVGHAVRAAYMYAGMADVAALMNDEAYLSAIDNIWDNVAQKKYYITGGIGARHDGEAFGSNYELPNGSAYCETCAAIANVYWNWRMFLLHGDSKYYDVVERTLYNGVISGIQLDGTKFFYPNPLASDGTHARSEWFGCACCPSNLCRFIASVPGYMYAHKDDKVYVNLYIQGSADINLGSDIGSIKLTQTTDYPWSGDIKLTVSAAQLNTNNLKLMLRLPGWAKGQPVPSDLYSYLNGENANIKLYVNGVETSYTLQDGYMMVEREWQVGDEVTFSLPMDVHRTVAHASVSDDQGLVSLERGPLVYCMEWPDNDEAFTSLIVPDNASIQTADGNVAGYELTTLNVAGQKLIGGSNTASSDITLIPYYAWANRGKGRMQVWIPRTADKASIEAWPVTVPISSLNIVHTQDIDIEYYPVSDGWTTHSLTGLTSDVDVPTALNFPITSFALDMMYAPQDNATICHAKAASSGKGFWYGNTDGQPGILFNQTNFDANTARIFLNIEGFYNSDKTLKVGYGQKPSACTDGTYIATIYMLAPTDAETGQHTACQFNFKFHLNPANIDELSDYSVEQPGITVAQLHRTFKQGKYNTLVLPFALTQEQAEQVFGTGSVLESISRHEDGVLKTESLTTTTAHIPFLLIPAQLTDDNIYRFPNILTVSGNAGYSNFTGGSMIGSYNAATTVSSSTISGKENYVISDNRFYLVANESGTMRGTRAYLVLDTDAAGGEAKAVIYIKDQTTGIDIPTNPIETEKMTAVYDLQGRYISDNTSFLQKGIYIINGKKVMIK